MRLSRILCVALVLLLLAPRTEAQTADCASATSISGAGTFPYSNAGGTSSPNGSCGTMGSNVYWSWRPDVAGLWSVETCGDADYDTVVALFDGCSGAEVACNDDNCPGFRSQVFVTAEAGVPLVVAVGGFESAVGSGTLETRFLGAPPVNNTCGTAAPIGGVGTFAFDNTSATTDGPAVSCSTGADQQIEGDVWYRWTATFTGTASATTCGLSGVDTMLAAYAGTVCPPGAELACNDDFCGLQTGIAFAVTQGEVVTIRLGTFPGSARGTGQITIAEGGPSTGCDRPDGGDIIVAELTSVQRWGAAGSVNGYSFGATACNVGDTPLPWEGATNRHPVITSNLYRVKDERIRQIGLSWLKHGFGSATQNTCCACQDPGDSQVVGIGCADTYSAGINGNQGGVGGGVGGLGRRSDLQPWTGVFPFPYPLQGATGDALYKRLQVENADLDPASNAGARYFGEVQYITPDEPADVHRDNNASYREVIVTGPAAGGWDLGFSGFDVRERPGIFAWQAVVPGVRITAVDVPFDGLLYVASHATDNGDGTWHYEYAVQNLNAHRAVGSVTVPVPAGTRVSAVGFTDADYHSGEVYDGSDWPGTVYSSAVKWTTSSFQVDPDANAIRWGTLYTFAFDADLPPATGDVALGLFRPGAPASLAGSAVMPGTTGLAFCDGSDDALAACPCGNAGGADSGCDNPQGTGGVRLEVLAQATDPVNTATLRGTGFPVATTPTAIVLRADAFDPSAPVSFGDGLRCVGVPVTRMAATAASAGQSTHVVGHGAGGGRFYYQLWYRSTPATFCDPTAAFNASGGRTLDW